GRAVEHVRIPTTAGRFLFLAGSVQRHRCFARTGTIEEPPGDGDRSDPGKQYFYTNRDTGGPHPPILPGAEVDLAAHPAFVALILYSTSSAFATGDAPSSFREQLDMADVGDDGDIARRAGGNLQTSEAEATVPGAPLTFPEAQAAPADFARSSPGALPADR